MSLAKLLKANVNLIDFFKLVMKYNWLSMRTMVGPLGMNRVWHATFKGAGNEITTRFSGIPKDLETITNVVSVALGRLGIELEKTDTGTIVSHKCPIYDWMTSEKIEIIQYELPCGDIICGAMADGLVKGLNPEYEVEVESRIEASLKKKKAEQCTFKIKKAPQALTVDEETCKHMFRFGHCAKFQFCPYNIGLIGFPPDSVKKYRDCVYYEPSMNKTPIYYRERYLPEGDEPVTDGILRDRSRAIHHDQI
ncbi:MAG: hypothetical protein ACFFDN_20990 [Candidatus Hodarchaeota archaeon]